jgi:hypothetical protein
VTRSEISKLRSLRSTMIALGIAVLLIIAAGVFAAVGILVADAPPGQGATFDPTGGSLSGVSPAMFAVAALGVVVVTSEYTSATIHSTFAAVPRRTLVVLAKALTLTIIVGPALIASTVAAFLGAQAVLATEQLHLSLGQPGVARAVIGAALYLTGVAVMAAGFGWLLRNTAGAVAVLLGVLVVLPVIGFFLPPAIGGAVLPYLPSNAGTAIMQLSPGALLPPWTGLAVFFLYVCLVLSAAVLAVRRRDA